MEMQDKTQYEQEWERAFADAEMEVSPSLWEKVELGVANVSEGKNKKRLLLFQLLAAASMAFALSIGGVAVYMLELNQNNAGDESISMVDSKKADKSDQPLTRESHDGQRALKTEANDNINNKQSDIEDETAVAENGEVSRSIKPSDDTSDNNSRNNNYNNTDEGDRGDNAQGKDIAIIKDENKSSKATDVMAPDKNDVIAPGNNDNVIALSDGNDIDANRNVTANDSEVLPQEIEHLFEYLEIAPLAEKELKMVPWYSYVPVKKAKQSDNLWAGVGFAAGSYNPNAGSGASGDMAQTAQTATFGANSLRAPSFTKEETGQAYNMGLNFGTRLSDKWVLQSGIVYTQQQTTSTSNVVSTNDHGSARTLTNSKELETADDVAFTMPYDVTNTYELISVPIQAGFVLLDNKLNIILLSGVANNILLNNHISSESEGIDGVNVSAGENSQYRTYQISGLIGSEFSYDLGSNYRLALIPQLRQSINSITKPDADYSSRPTTLEIGFRFKYVFNN